MCAQGFSGRPLLPGHSLVIITLDCVRPDFLGCYGCESVRTPTLDRLAAGGVVFEQAITQAPNTWVSHAGILCGLYPPQHGLRSPYDRLPPGLSTLASRLAAQGYATAGFPGNELAGSRMGLDQGFAFFHEAFRSLEEPEIRRYQLDRGRAPGPEAPAGSSRDPAAGPVRILGRSDWADVLQTAGDWLSRQQGPAFLWFHYLDTHHLPELELPDYYRFSREPRWQYYEGKVSYADDRCVRAIIDLLREHGRFEETLIVVLSDHGEGLFPGMPPAHNGELTEEVLRVPLILYGARSPWKGLRVPFQVRTMDLAPTLLGVLCGQDIRTEAEVGPLPSGVPLPLPGLGGGAVGPELARGFAYAENEPFGHFCVRTGEWKFVLRPEGEALFHLATGAAGQGNVIHRHPWTAAYLREQLEAVRDAGRRNPRSPADREAEETRRLLRSLGYVQ